MWPWLLGLGAIGLLAAGAGGKAGVRAPTSSSSVSHPYVSPNVPLTAANIQKAAAYALAHETNAANLVAFGNALVLYGYPSLGNPLITKQQHLSGTGSAPPPETIAWWLNKYTGSNYKTGQQIALTDVGDAVHNALLHATHADIATLQAFEQELVLVGQTNYAKWVTNGIAALKAGKTPKVPAAPTPAASSAQQTAVTQAATHASAKPFQAIA